MMPGSNGIHALSHQLREIDFDFFPTGFFVACPAGSQYLFHCVRKPVGVSQHEFVELLLPRLGQFASLQRFQMQTNGRQRSLQFMRDRIDETVMLLTAPQLPNQKNCIYDHAGNNQGEEDDAEKQQHTFTPVENDPPHVQGDRQRNQANPQAKEEDDRSASARNAHGFRLILQGLILQPQAGGRAPMRSGLLSEWQLSYVSKNKSPDRSRGFSSTILGHLVSRGSQFRNNQPSIRRRYQSLLDFRQADALDIPCQPEFLESPDAIPVGIDLVPLKPVGTRRGMRVVIVVPTLAKRQQSHPPAVGG